MLILWLTVMRNLHNYTWNIIIIKNSIIIIHAFEIFHNYVLYIINKLDVIKIIAWFLNDLLHGNFNWFYQRLMINCLLNIISWISFKWWVNEITPDVQSSE